MEELYIIDGETYEEVHEQLMKAKEEMIKLSQEGSSRDEVDLVAFSNGRGNPVPEIKVTEEFGGFAIVLNGHSLVSEGNPCYFSVRFLYIMDIMYMWGNAVQSDVHVV